MVNIKVITFYKCGKSIRAYKLLSLRTSCMSARQVSLTARLVTYPGRMQRRSCKIMNNFGTHNKLPTIQYF